MDLNEIANFITLSKDTVVNHELTQEKYNEEINKGLKGPQEASNLLSEKKREDLETLKMKQDKLLPALNNWKEKELSDIELKQTPITQNDLAELSLLSELDVTSEDLTKYIEKYKNNDLAIRKLKMISEQKGLLVRFPRLRKEFLESMVSRVENDIKDHANPLYGKSEPYLSLVEQGNIESHKNLFKEYKKL